MALDKKTATLAGRSKDQLIDSFIFAGDDHLVHDVWSAGRHLVTAGRHVAASKDHQRTSRHYPLLLISDPAVR